MQKGYKHINVIDFPAIYSGKCLFVYALGGGRIVQDVVVNAGSLDVAIFGHVNKLTVIGAKI